jgi:uncharacterized membrane protein YfcA
VTLIAIAGAIAVLAGGVAAVAGFGIGSLLTPALIPLLGTRLAVVAVAVPHAIGTALRLWRLRDAIDWKLLRGFGVASAAGGLAGALAHGWLSGASLTKVFGALLILSGLAALVGWTKHVHLSRMAALIAGATAGLFGGLVGNQGSIRSAALLAFPLPPRAFVATATATAMIVDAARLPVYLAQSGSVVRDNPALIATMTAGVVIGTLAGDPVLRRIPERWFSRIVGVLLLALGMYMLTQSTT